MRRTSRRHDMTSAALAWSVRRCATPAAAPNPHKQEHLWRAQAAAPCCQIKLSQILNMLFVPLCAHAKNATVWRWRVRRARGDTYCHCKFLLSWIGRCFVHSCVDKRRIRP